ncbi:MAG: transglycosylase SLT domain-containing protein [Solirubrobacterales bacterium]
MSGRLTRLGHAQDGQALVLMVAGCLLALASTLVLAQFGAAFVARGRVQRASDLAATAAAARMSADYERLFVPPTLGNGLANPLHLDRGEYLARARGAALRSARANSIPLAAGRITFDRDAAPTRVTVRAAATHRVSVPGGTREPVPVRALATARLRFAIGAMARPMPGLATGGGYRGPLAYRQGKPMRPETAAAFDRLHAAAARAGQALTIASALRSDQEQARLFAQRPDPKWVAPPGTSLHRYGTELDIGPPSAYAWLASNARGFGFIKRYAWEPWHFGLGANPRDVPARYEQGSFEPPSGRFDGRGLPSFVPARYAATIAAAAQRWNVQSELLAAQLKVESNFDPNAVSPAGAQGIAQFMPATARAVGLADPFDPRQAIDAQAKLISGLIRRFDSISQALAAYNAGPGAVERYGGVPPYAETQTYVARILSLVKGNKIEFNDPAFAGIAVTPSVELIR